MKRFLSILLAVVMTLSMITPVFAASYSDTKGNDYEAAIEHLSGLGVIAGYEDGSFKPEKVVTRAEMAKLLVVSLGLEQGASILEGTSMFTDTVGHWAVGFINVAAQYGLIKGDGDGNFRPDDTVNYAEAATMCLRALGYERVVEKAGQWPTNYLNKANELKLFEDIASFTGTDGAVRGSVAQLMWNMVNTQMWVVTTENETNGVNYGPGGTMLELKFADFTRKSEDGKYVLVNFVDKYVDFEAEENPTQLTIKDKNTIILDGVEFDNVSPIEFEDALAYEALYTVEKNGTLKGASLVIKTKIENGTSTVFGTVEDVTETKITVDGKEYTFEEKNEAKYFGLVVLTLNKYNKVEDVRSLYSEIGEDIVKKVTTEDDKTSVELYIGGEYEIKEENDVYTLQDKNIMISDFEGNVLELSDISEKDIVSLFKVDGETPVEPLYIVVSDGKVAGEFEKLVEDKIVIDGTEYNWNEDSKIKYASKDKEEALDLSKVKGQIGENIVVYATLNNHIVLIEAEDEIIEDNYAYLTRIYQYVTEDGEVSLRYKLLTLDGETVSYEVCDKDGNKLVLSDLPEEEAQEGAEEGAETVTADSTNVIDNVNKLVKFQLLDGMINADEFIYLDKESTSEVEMDVTINKLNDTRKVINDKLIITADTKYVKAEIDEDTDKLSLTEFKYSDLSVGSKVYAIITEAADSDKVAYIVINADVNSDANIAIVMSEVAEYADDVLKVSLYNIETGKTEEVVLAESSKQFPIGTVVEFTVNTSDKYTLDEVKAGHKTVKANEDKETTTSAGEGYLSILDAEEGADIVISEDAKVIFVDTDNTVSEKSLSSIKDGYKVYAAEEHENSKDADKIYKTIIVVKK